VLTEFSQNGSSICASLMYVIHVGNQIQSKTWKAIKQKSSVDGGRFRFYDNQI